MSSRSMSAALVALLILQGTMLLSLLFKLPPHPPETIPLGGMAPVIAASLSASAAALIYQGQGGIGRVFVLVACLLAGLSFGPQKFFDPAFPLVWPAVITGQVAILVLLVPLLRDVGGRVRRTKRLSLV